MTSYFSFLFCFCRRIFALNLHAGTTAPAGRDLQEYDIDVYVRLDLLVTIVKKVTLKIGEVFVFLILTQWSISSKSPRFRIDRTYDTY